MSVWTLFVLGTVSGPDWSATSVIGVLWTDDATRVLAVLGLRLWFCSMCWLVVMNGYWDVIPCYGTLVVRGTVLVWLPCVGVRLARGAGCSAIL